MSTHACHIKTDLINKKKAKLPWDCGFRLISEHWSIGVLEWKGVKA
jgi:hypothetical protein